MSTALLTTSLMGISALIIVGSNRLQNRIKNARPGTNRHFIPTNTLPKSFQMLAWLATTVEIQTSLATQSSVTPLTQTHRMKSALLSKIQKVALAEDSNVRSIEANKRKPEVGKLANIGTSSHHSNTQALRYYSQTQVLKKTIAETQGLRCRRSSAIPQTPTPRWKSVTLSVPTTML